MIIYLDQNKWIELARIENGIDKSNRDIKILDKFKNASKNGCVFPLASTHYIELSRIKNPDRRRRLGSFMWELSQGTALLSYKQIIEREIEVALQSLGLQITVRELNIIGSGIDFIFGNLVKPKNFNYDNLLICKDILTGEGAFGFNSMQTMNLDFHRKNFFNHLEEINEKKHLLSKSKWDDWLHAISMTDIIKPLFEVFCLHNLNKSILENMNKDELKNLLMMIPTRKLDIHLHRQVIRNDEYKPKHSDLEDWAGIGLASCYCDIVVCEKHFADMLQRDSYKPFARIVRNLDDVFN